MATIGVNFIITQAQSILQDVTGIRWPAAELLGWLNDGQREIVLFKPNSFVKNTIIQLASGTNQQLPADGVQLIDVVRNMGQSGSTPGNAIRITMREILDSNTPNWHASTPSNVVLHYMYSELNPKNFYVYPPQPSTGQNFVEIIYGAAPTDTAINGTITLDDIYQNVLLDYMLYRAYSKDTEWAADQNRAATHQNAYLTALKGKTAMEDMANPNKSAPANPNTNRNPN